MKNYHNPHCSTARKVLKMVTDSGIEPEIILYQIDPLFHKKLDALLRKMKMASLDLVRKKDNIYKTNYKAKELSNEEWIQAMIDHPRLMERPIVENGKKALLDRPLENIEYLLCK